MRPIAASVVAAFVSVLAWGAGSVPAFAQAGPSKDTPEVMPPPGEPGGAPAPAEPKKPAGPVGGYAYSDKPTASSKPAHHGKYRKSGPVVNMPGFEQTGDGGSRLFVQLSQNVPVEERKAKGSITYVLKGASPRVHNNTNALVTVHFNTPVSKARLIPKGSDLLFVIDLRADATPTWKVNEGPEKSSVLTIDFPKGDFLPAGGEAKDDPSASGASDEEGEGEAAAPKAPKPPKVAAPKPPSKKPGPVKAPAAPAAPKP